MSARLLVFILTLDIRDWYTQPEGNNHVQYNSRNMRSVTVLSWWCHQTETLSVLLVLCEGNPPVTGGFSSQRASSAVLRCFFYIRLGKRWIDSGVVLTVMWRHCNDRVLSWFFTTSACGGLDVPANWGFNDFDNVLTEILYPYSEGWFPLFQWRNRGEYRYRAYSRLAHSQGETSLQSNATSHWLGANLESALKVIVSFKSHKNGIITMTKQSSTLCAHVIVDTLRGNPHHLSRTDHKPLPKPMIGHV